MDIASEHIATRRMISSKEHQVFERMNQKYIKNGSNLKLKKDGTLDMRYGENIKLFCQEYKKIMLLENRKYNDICQEKQSQHRDDILKLSEKQFENYYLKN
tara:strand:- start:4341 stop:4643 length:303 start_codon:yes stop_codon:yes gene_type:complete